MPLDVRVPIEPDNPSIVRAEEKCIKCGMCKNVCTQDIGVHGTYTLEQTGGEAVCIHCGQCANVCPPSSITERYEYPEIRDAVKNPDQIVIISTSPSVRAALGEEFGRDAREVVEGKKLPCLDQVRGNVFPGADPQSLYRQESDRHAGADDQDLFCKENGT